MLSIECVTPRNKRYMWRIVDYLQRDAAAKGVKKSKSYFDSFWHQLGYIAQDHRKVWVALNQHTHHLYGYMVVNTCLTDSAIMYGDTLRLDFLEILPRHRSKGVGRQMVNWLKERATTKQFGIIHIPHTLDETVGFWEAMGFTEIPGESGLWWDCSYDPSAYLDEL